MSIAQERQLRSILTLGFELKLRTGLRVGASEASLVIGGDENLIVRDPLTNRPYIPGSSLKGKTRSLLERALGLPQNRHIRRDEIVMHACERKHDYGACVVCNIFGVPAPSRERWFCQTRLRVADLFLTDGSERALRDAGTILPYTEVKSEAAIDRVSSVAMPRTMERVPAGAVFHGDLTLLVYAEDDVQSYIDCLVQGMQLLEADYLGGGGGRGSGRVSFESILPKRMTWPAGGGRVVTEPLTTGTLANVEAFADARDEIVAWIESDG